MGTCRICKRLGCYGFAQPGTLSERSKKGYVWACRDHRNEVEKQWQEAFGSKRKAL